MAFTAANPTSSQGTGENTAHKRPAWEHGNERPSKRRAAKACLSCRSRKVRCDVLNGGHPCTNCRLDELACVVKESNRGRKPATTSATSAQAPLESPQHNHQHNQTSSQVNASSISDSPSPCPRRASGPSDDLISLAFEGRRSRSFSQEAVEGTSLNVQSQSHVIHESNPSPRDDGPLILSPTSGHQSLPAPSSSAPYLPPYIRPLPRHITPTDLSYLAEKGALAIPDNVFRDELLRTFTTIVYPFMPTVDLEDFLIPIIRGDGREQVSLLLFQAVMFASVSFIDTDFLQSRGYSSKKEARKIFFGRARLLYALECERDHLPLLQSVLLMSYWYDCPDDGKDMWYWSGIALNLAQVVGMHRERELRPTTVKHRKLRRRIWWSCVIQDRLMALAMRRPSRIRDEEFDVAQLTLDDFDLSAPSHEVSRLLGESRFTEPDPSARSAMAVMCIELSKLCVCVGHILHSQYATVSDQPMISEYLLRIVIVPKQTSSSHRDLARYDAELNSWHSNQDPQSKYTPGPRHPGDKDDKATYIIRLHQAVLQMNYLSAVSVLHKPQVFDASDTTEVSAQKKSSREKVSKAAVAMAKLAFDLQTSNQLQLLSITGVAAFISATLTHLNNIRSQDEELRSISIGRFYQCMHALQQLQSMYSSADYAIHFLEAVLRKINIAVPTLVPGFPSTRPDWNKPQLLGCPESTPDRVATAYPSPSSCPNNQPYAAMSDWIGNPCADAGNAHPEAWSGVSGQTAGGQGQGDVLVDPSMGNWLDISSLVPALMNFEGDSTWAVPGNTPTGGELGLY